MTTRPVHFIAHLTINDRSLYRDYVEGFFPLLAEREAVARLVEQ